MLNKNWVVSWSFQRLATFSLKTGIALLVAFQLTETVTAETPGSERAPYRVSTGEEWNYLKSGELTEAITSRALRFEFKSVLDFEKKLPEMVADANSRGFRTLMSHLTKNDYTQYYWIFHFTTGQVSGARSKYFQGVLYEAVYVNNGTQDLGVYVRMNLLNIRDDVEWAFKYSREFPGSQVVFEDKDGPVVVNFPGDIYNSSKEGMKKRYQNLSQLGKEDTQ